MNYRLLCRKQVLCSLLGRSRLNCLLLQTSPAMKNTRRVQNPQTSQEIVQKLLETRITAAMVLLKGEWILGLL